MFEIASKSVSEIDKSSTEATHLCTFQQLEMQSTTTLLGDPRVAHMESKALAATIPGVFSIRTKAP